MSVKQLNVRLYEDVIKDIKVFAIEKNLNINTVVQRALEFYLMCQSDVIVENANLEHLNRELQHYILNDNMIIKLELK